MPAIDIDVAPPNAAAADELPLPHVPVPLEASDTAQISVRSIGTPPIGAGAPILLEPSVAEE
jgi:hypothetical protein